MEEVNKPIVFISTSSNTKDLELTRCLNNLLKVSQIRTYFYGDFRPDSFQKEIERAILDSTIFVPIFSPEYFKSEHCTSEIEAWKNKRADYQKRNQLDYPQRSPYPIIPIKWQECDIPFTYQSYQYISAATCEEVFEKLIDMIQKETPFQPKEPRSPTIDIYNYYRSIKMSSKEVLTFLEN